MYFSIQLSFEIELVCIAFHKHIEVWSSQRLYVLVQFRQDGHVVQTLECHLLDFLGRRHLRYLNQNVDISCLYERYLRCRPGKVSNG